MPMQGAIEGVRKVIQEGRSSALKVGIAAEVFENDLVLALDELSACVMQIRAMTACPLDLQNSLLSLCSNELVALAQDVFSRSKAFDPFDYAVEKTVLVYLYKTLSDCTAMIADVATLQPRMQAEQDNVLKPMVRSIDLFLHQRTISDWEEIYIRLLQSDLYYLSHCLNGSDNHKKEYLNWMEIRRLMYALLLAPANDKASAIVTRANKLLSDGALSDMHLVSLFRHCLDNLSSHTAEYKIINTAYADILLKLIKRGHMNLTMYSELKSTLKGQHALEEKTTINVNAYIYKYERKPSLFARALPGNTDKEWIARVQTGEAADQAVSHIVRLKEIRLRVTSVIDEIDRRRDF